MEGARSLIKQGELILPQRLGPVRIHIAVVLLGALLTPLPEPFAMRFGFKCEPLVWNAQRRDSWTHAKPLRDAILVSTVTPPPHMLATVCDCLHMI